MDGFEGRCWLDWWANSSTLLGSAEVTVVIAVADGGWSARGRFINDDPDEREAFDFLCALDPVVSLRFEDDSSFPVAVQDPDDTGWFIMEEYTGPAPNAQPPGAAGGSDSRGEPVGGRPSRAAGRRCGSTPAIARHS